MAEYIEREEIYRRWKDIPAGTSLEVLAEGILLMATAVVQIPAADVAPVVHGRWTQCFEDRRQQIEGDKCSACGFEHYGTNIRDYRYCPNCGAKMDLEG